MNLKHYLKKSLDKRTWLADELQSCERTVGPRVIGRDSTDKTEVQFCYQWTGAIARQLFQTSRKIYHWFLYREFKVTRYQNMKIVGKAEFPLIIKWRVTNFRNKRVPTNFLKGCGNSWKKLQRSRFILSLRMRAVAIFSKNLSIHSFVFIRIKLSKGEHLYGESECSAKLENLEDFKFTLNFFYSC